VDVVDPDVADTVSEEIDTTHKVEIEDMITTRKVGLEDMDTTHKVELGELHKVVQDSKYGTENVVLSAASTYIATGITAKTRQVSEMYGNWTLGATRSLC